MIRYSLVFITLLTIDIAWKKMYLGPVSVCDFSILDLLFYQQIHINIQTRHDVLKQTRIG